MIKLLPYILLVLSLISSDLKAQVDSLAAATRAEIDAAHFKLNKADLAQFRKDRAAYRSNTRSNLSLNGNKIHSEYNKIDYMSDFFKPTRQTTTDTTLLNDSVYVRAFRSIAYKKTTNRHSAMHYVGIGAVIVVGLTLICYTIYVFAGLDSL